jgi:RNA polymerase sigma factor (TIGR02999 family)
MDQDDTTTLLLRASRGSVEDSEQLFNLVYDELRSMAQREMQKERIDHTLRPTELVHEVYLRLIDQTRIEWQSQAHFKAVACRAMRQILVDHARHRNRRKRAGGKAHVRLEDFDIADQDPDTTIVALDRALEKLARIQPVKARLVELHFFGGLTYEECADVLNLSLRTVTRYWTYAQAWLSREMSAA